MFSFRKPAVGTAWGPPETAMRGDDFAKYTVSSQKEKLSLGGGF